MLFWKKSKNKVSGSVKWYPRLVTIGKPVTTKELAERIARESTVSPADVYAVCHALPVVMGEFMAESRSVHLEGIGYFRYSCQASGNGVDTPEKVTSDLINGVRVQFQPERQKVGTTYERAMIGKVSFSEWFGKEEAETPGEEGEEPVGE